MSNSEASITPATRVERRRIVRRVARAGVALALVAGGLVAGTAASAATGGTITVTPSTQLVSGQTVTVTGSGWGSNAAVGWCEGVPSSPPDQQYCNTGSIVLATADADGNFSGQIRITRFLQHVGPTGYLVDCADPARTCVVGAADQTDVAGTAVTVRLKFATVPHTIFPGTGSVVEGNADTTVVHVAVRLSQAQATQVTVQWTTKYVVGAPGAQAVPIAVADSIPDYVPAAGTVTFAAGQTLKTVSITVNGETYVEPDEYIVVAFSHPVNAVMGGFWGFGFATITNDD